MGSERDDERGARRWASVGAASLALVALVVVLGEATDRGQPTPGGPATAVPLPVTTIGDNTTSTSATPTTFGAESRELRRIVPGVAGTLHALVGDSNRQLVEIPTEIDTTLLRPASEPLGFVTSFGFDHSGTLLGFLDGGEDGTGSDRLNVWSETAMFGFGDIGVVSYRWHAADPRRLAAITVDATGHAVLRTFEFGDVDLVAGIDSVTDVDASQTLVGWGDFGFLISSHDPSSETPVTTLLDRRGGVVWQRQDMTVLDVSSDRVLALMGRSGEHYVVDPGDPDAANPLFALPREMTVTGSDFSPDGQLAVHYPLESRDSNLRIYDAGFGTFTDFVLEGWRVWDLEWSSDGRFVVMPGTDDGGGHVVIFYDTSTEGISLLYFNTWVQWASLN